MLVAQESRTCRHCHDFPAHPRWARGLCWACRKSPDVRALYPSTNKAIHRGVMNGHITPPLPPEPTLAMPGSAEKVAVMEARAAAGLHLHHPQDAVLTRPPEVVQVVYRFTPPGKRDRTGDSD